MNDTVFRFLNRIETQLHQNPHMTGGDGDSTLPYGLYEDFMNKIVEYIRIIYENKHKHTKLLSDDVYSRENEMKEQYNIPQRRQPHYDPAYYEPETEEAEDKPGMFQSINNLFKYEKKPVNETEDKPGMFQSINNLFQYEKKPVDETQDKPVNETEDKSVDETQDKPGIFQSINNLFKYEKKPVENEDNDRPTEGEPIQEKEEYKEIEEYKEGEEYKEEEPKQEEPKQEGRLLLKSKELV